MPRDIVIEYVPNDRPIRTLMPPEKLFNLHLEMVENKKKLLKNLPPLPDWAKFAPKAVPKKPAMPVKKSSAPIKPQDSVEPLEKQVTDKKPMDEKPAVVKVDKNTTNKDPEPDGVKKTITKEESEAGSEEEDEEEEDDESEEEEEDDDSEEEEEDDESGASEAKNLGELEKDFETSETANVPSNVQTVFDEKDKETEEQKLEKEKQKYLRKWKIILYRMRQKAATSDNAEFKKQVAEMKEFTEYDSLEIIKKATDDQIFMIRQMASMGRSKFLLNMSFVGVEALVSNVFGSQFFDGYAQFQLNNSHVYDDILAEIAAEDDSSWFQNMTPMQQLMFTVVQSTAAFAIGKYQGIDPRIVTSMITGSPMIEPQAPGKIHLD